MSKRAGQQPEISCSFSLSKLQSSSEMKGEIALFHVLWSACCALGLGLLSKDTLLQRKSLNQAKLRCTAKENIFSTNGLMDYLNAPAGNDILSSLFLMNNDIKSEMAKVNFWNSGNFIINQIACHKVTKEGMYLRAECKIKDKLTSREAFIPHAYPVSDENMLKASIIAMLNSMGRIKDTASIMKLPYGEDGTMPKNFLFNNVPHAAWVRAYVYQSVTDAVLSAVQDPRIPDKSRMLVNVNIPEVNPAFDTYRIGTVLELVRSITLPLTVQYRQRVRICVQQSLGEGVFAGLPLALSSMKPILERMDWGPNLTPEEKFSVADYKQPRKEALIRLGAVGADQVADDDDILILISPQNIVGGMLVGLVEDMVKAAKGRPLILLNPRLEDRPSANNMMQIRGRGERLAFTESFTNIFTLKLLYPSSGGYMYPIRGMIGKKSYHSPWIVYEKKAVGEDEVYDIVAALDPYKDPDPSVITALLT